MTVWCQGAQEAISACLEQLGLCYVDGARGTLTPDVDEVVRLLQDSMKADNPSATAELWRAVEFGSRRKNQPV